jgi:hypothetical protein
MSLTFLSVCAEDDGEKSQSSINSSRIAHNTVYV